MKQPITILWIRRDLRLADNPALQAAIARGRVVPVYILEEKRPWAIGGAARWWLHHALDDLSHQFSKKGVELILRQGNPKDALTKLAQECDADTVVWSRRYEPFDRQQEIDIEAYLRNREIDVKSFNASLLFEPHEIQTKSGSPYKVFTPFARACLSAPSPTTLLATPTKIHGKNGIKSERLTDWSLLPSKPDWSAGLKASWELSEKAAHKRLDHFLEEGLAGYKTNRDRPDLDGTSRLSPYLAWGQISPRQVWYAAHQAMNDQKDTSAGGECFLKELLWREFSYHLLYHFPDLPTKPLISSFGEMAWQEDKKLLHLWQKGETGYPIVDAGMRQLWQTGWMHNRVRMIVASFLVKDLLIPWQAGEAWFWDTLVDANLASNAASWQWVAGCGADAAPFFRVFNPTLQSKKFDPEGGYIARYVPELSTITGKGRHAPWRLEEAQRPSGYPERIIDHDAARARALTSFRRLKET